MEATNYFFGRANADPIEVSIGVHLYKFSCRIPRNAPGSVEGKYGFIRYKVEVVLDVPLSQDLTCEKRFVVVRHEDLNKYPELRIPNEVEVVKTFCCFVCESDPVLVKMSTPASGYTLGEDVPVKIEIFNRSSVGFSKSLISLNRVEIFNSYTPVEKTKKQLTPITAVIGKGVEAKKNVSFQKIIHIPQNSIVSNDRISNVFQVTYEIKFYMKATTRGSSSIKISVPIYVGTIGFRLGSTASQASIGAISMQTDELREFETSRVRIKN